MMIRLIIGFISLLAMFASGYTYVRTGSEHQWLLVVMLFCLCIFIFCSTTSRSSYESVTEDNKKVKLEDNNLSVAGNESILTCIDDKIEEVDTSQVPESIPTVPEIKKSKLLIVLTNKFNINESCRLYISNTILNSLHELSYSTYITTLNTKQYHILTNSDNEKELNYITTKQSYCYIIESDNIQSIRKLKKDVLDLTPLFNELCANRYKNIIKPLYVTGDKVKIDRFIKLMKPEDISNEG